MSMECTVVSYQPAAINTLYAATKAGKKAT